MYRCHVLVLVNWFAGKTVVLQKSERNAGDVKSHVPLFNLDSYSKQAGDECHLLHAVSFFYATDLPFPEHIDRFISLQGAPRGLERKEAHSELDKSFDEAMILLNEVVEVVLAT